MIGMFVVLLILPGLNSTPNLEGAVGQLGAASYYNNASVDNRWGGITKSGEKFDENLRTVAVHPSRWKELKGKYLKVTHRKTGKSTIAKVNDTGGFKKYGRLVDLSQRAFLDISDTDVGVAPVEVEVLGGKVAQALQRRK